MQRISAVFGRVFDAMMLAACLLLLFMTLLIGADVATRNLGVGGIAWSNEVSENILYLITLLSAPWLLRQGKHIRVDIMLRAIPPRAAWNCEWIADMLGLACSLVIAWYGVDATLDAYRSGEMFIKAVATPVWWWLALLPVAFLMLAT